MEKIELLRTDFQIERDKRDLALYEDFQELMSVEGQSITKVHALLMERYKIHSESTIYEIRKRVAERFNNSNK